MFLTSGALGDCCELQLWHHGSPVSVAGAVLHGPMPRLVVWVPSWGSPGRTELWPLLSYYAMTFTLKILPSEFTPGKTASQKAGEKKNEEKKWAIFCPQARAPLMKKGASIGAGSKSSEPEKMMSTIFLPRELYLQNTKTQCHVPGKKIAKRIQEPCLWVIALRMSHSGFSLLCSGQRAPYHFPVTVQPLLRCQPSKTETSLPPGFFLSL